jgi:hypothetical protein
MLAGNRRKAAGTARATAQNRRSAWRPRSPRPLGDDRREPDLTTGQGKITDLAVIASGCRKGSRLKAQPVPRDREPEP